MTKLLNNLLEKLSCFHKEDEKNEEIDPRDGTPEGDEILGKAVNKIRKQCKLITEEEFYREVDM